MDARNKNTDDLFSKVLTGNASEQELLEFANWQNESEQSRTGFQEYKKTWESTGLLKSYDLERAKLMTEVKILEKLRAARGFFYYWQRIAAILIIPLLIFSSVYYFTNERGGVSATSEIVKTPYGARTSFELPDGSVAWLNSGSELSYPHRFGKTREINLKGEVYLEVKKGNKPFIVKTKYGNVKVLGTKFNVSAFPGEPFNTTLVEGSVAIKNNTNPNEIILKPGFQYVAENGKYSVEKVQPEMYTSWKDGKMVFRREPFCLVAKRLERWINVSIKLEGETIKNLWYTGTIEMESFSEVLELVKNTTPIIYSFDAKTRVLTITVK